MKVLWIRLPDRARQRLYTVLTFDPNPLEDCAESGCEFPLAFPVPTPGSNTYQCPMRAWSLERTLAERYR